MTFEDAIRKAMRVYWNHTDDYDNLESNKKRKYTKSYFDSIEKEMLKPKDLSKNKLKEYK